MMSNSQIVLITSGEPSGIGPDICLDLPYFSLSRDYILIVVGDIRLLSERAKLLNKRIKIRIVSETELIHGSITPPDLSELLVLHVDCPIYDCIGIPKVQNAQYVLRILDSAIHLTKLGVAKAMVTAPVNKQIINQAGYRFLGHTEYLAQRFGSNKVVMMLANSSMKVALLTTHLALKDVPAQVTVDNLNQTLQVICDSFANQFNIHRPKIAVCGLNPHAGEGGYLGQEEVEIINPVIKKWQERGYLISGSHSADTIFNSAKDFDVILVMYHDQGLPVLKYAGFETGVNVTLGLPIIRTSVDHGTALSLAGSGRASSKSLRQAVQFAIDMMNKENT